MTDTAKLLIFSCKECRRPSRFCIDAYTRFGNLRGYELTYTPTSHINGVDVCCPRDADGDCDYVAGHRCQLVPVSLHNCVRLSSATGHAVCVHCEAVLEQGVCCDELFGEMDKLFGEMNLSFDYKIEASVCKIVMLAARCTHTCSAAG